MQTEYRLVFDSTYCRQMIGRYYRQRPLIIRPVGQFVLLSMLFLLAWLVVIGPHGSGVMPVIIGLCLCVVGPFLVKWGVLLRMRSRANFGSAFEVTVADTGISASGTHTTGKWEWPAYPEAVRFSDGLLLMRRGVIRWLPDSGLVQGSPAEATKIVSAKCKLRHIA